MTSEDLELPRFVTLENFDIQKVASIIFKMSRFVFSWKKESHASLVQHEDDKICERNCSLLSWITEMLKG